MRRASTILTREDMTGGERASRDTTPRMRHHLQRVARAFLLVVVLAARMPLCLSESANAGEINSVDGPNPAAATGDLLKTTAVGEESEPMIVLGTTPADLHTLIEGVRAPPTGSGCAHWPVPDSMTGILVPLQGAAWLLVGGREMRGQERTMSRSGACREGTPCSRLGRSSSADQAQVD